jgi:glycosyltransferase involved in cell wall biosynthesis
VTEDWTVLVKSAEDLGNDGRFSEAIALAERAITAAPLEALPAITLAELLRKRALGDEAVRVLRAALTRMGERADLWNHLGLALRDDAQEAESLAAFRRAAQLEPDGAWAATNMEFGLLRQSGDRAVESFAALGRMADPAEVGLGLFCDRFPHTYGFLIQQFVTYLRHFPDAAAYSFGRKVLEPYHPRQFGEAMGRFAASYPDLSHRVTQLVPVLDGPPGQCTHARAETRGGRFRKPRLAHNIFAMNADLFRPLYETLGIPFTFTLNPGGAFRLDHPHSDDRLRRVFDSPLFRKVIVTYPLTRDYIISRFQIPEDRIALIPGTIVVESLLDAHRRPKRRYGVDKDSLDLCFVGMRYSPTGADKGYDRFIAAMHLLAPRLPRLRIHVVGNFDARTVDCSALADRVTFHGPRDQRWLAAFYAEMDAIVSPNAADQLAKGAFDGFPVTSCIEAGMCGVALFATDPMGLNMWLRDGVDYVAIDRAPARLADCLESWLAEPERLYALAANGEERFHAHWGEAAQMGPRVALMTELLAREG